MTIDEATNKCFELYLNLLHSKGFKPRNNAEFKFHQLSKTDQLNHAMFMCSEILKAENSHYSLDKKSRWLGFVQCVLIMHGYTTIEAERNRTRPWFKGDSNETSEDT